MIEKIVLPSTQGKLVTGRRITVSSQFDADVNIIWQKIQDIKTLQTICSPLARFVPCGDAAQVWEQGRTLRFKLWVNGIVPLGVHTIHIRELNETTHEIHSEESNRYVPIWRHIIEMESREANPTRYTDIVDTWAGPLTPLVAWWAERFYKHRQRRWQTLLRAALSVQKFD
jgi:hypothetical protein